MVVGREVRLEAMDAAQVQLAPGNHLKKNGKTPSGPRGADALAGRRLGHVKARDTEIEHRGMASFGPQLTLVDDVDVPEQVGRVVVILLNQVAELVEERLVTEAFERRVR